MTAAAAVAPLELARVRQRIAQVRELLADARELLAELYDSRAWITLGLPSWDELCRRELPELAELLTLAERKALVVELRRGGLSLRAAAAPAGVAANTARAWIADAGVSIASTTSLDGRVRPATSTTARPKVAARPLVDRVVELLAANPAGLDVLEVARRLRVRQSQASPALCRMAAAGRISYRPGARRGQLGRYVATVGGAARP